MPASASPLVLGDRRLRIDELVQVARGRRDVVLAPRARLRLSADRAAVEALADSARPVYGISTGLGAAVDTVLDRAERLAFQARVPQARAVGVGAAMAADAVRAVMLARAACAAFGGSGLRPETVEAILAALNRGFHPVVPSIGSVSEGDLPPLAAIACALMGIGEAELDGMVRDAGEALLEAGLAPLVPGIKEGLALVGVNAQSAGEGALLAADAAVALRALEAQGALAIAAFGAKTDAMQPSVLALRPAPGAEAVAERLRRWLEGGTPIEDASVQSPLSFRLAAHLGGAAQDQLDRFTGLVEVELNFPGDNPVVLGDEVLHSGNFDTTPLAIAAEALQLGLAHVASAAVQRSLRLMSPRFTSLPRFLTPHGQSRTGFATVQKTLAALDGSIRHLALPVALPSIPVADQVEDVGPLSTLSIAKAREMLVRVRLVASVGLVVAAQAADLRGDPGAWLPPRLRRLQEVVRAIVPMLEEDRPLGPGFGRLAAAIEAGAIDGI